MPEINMGDKTDDQEQKSGSNVGRAFWLVVAGIGVETLAIAGYGLRVLYLAYPKVFAATAFMFILGGMLAIVCGAAAREQVRGIGTGSS